MSPPFCVLVSRVVSRIFAMQRHIDLGLYGDVEAAAAHPSPASVGGLGESSSSSSSSQVVIDEGLFPQDYLSRV